MKTNLSTALKTILYFLNLYYIIKSTLLKYFEEGVLDVPTEMEEQFNAICRKLDSEPHLLENRLARITGGRKIKITHNNMCFIPPKYSKPDFPDKNKMILYLDEEIETITAIATYALYSFTTPIIKITQTEEYIASFYIDGYEYRLIIDPNFFLHKHIDLSNPEEEKAILPVNVLDKHAYADLDMAKEIIMQYLCGLNLS